MGRDGVIQLRRERRHPPRRFKKARLFDRRAIRETLAEAAEKLAEKENRINVN